MNCKSEKTKVREYFPRSPSPSKLIAIILDGRTVWYGRVNFAWQLKIKWLDYKIKFIRHDEYSDVYCVHIFDKKIEERN